MWPPRPRACPSALMGRRARPAHPDRGDDRYCEGRRKRSVSLAWFNDPRSCLILPRPAGPPQGTSSNLAAISYDCQRNLIVGRGRRRDVSNPAATTTSGSPGPLLPKLNEATQVRQVRVLGTLSYCGEPSAPTTRSDTAKSALPHPAPSALSYQTAPATECVAGASLFDGQPRPSASLGIRIAAIQLPRISEPSDCFVGPYVESGSLAPPTLAKRQPRLTVAAAAGVSIGTHRRRRPAQSD
jgi:hypothetical protein